MPNKVVFKSGDRVLCPGWSMVKPFIGIVDRPSASRSNYWVRSEIPIFCQRTHIKNRYRLKYWTGLVQADLVQPVTLLDDLAHVFRQPLLC